MSDFSPFIGL